MAAYPDEPDAEHGMSVMT